MLIKRPDGIKPSEITSRSDYLSRRQFLERAGHVAIAGATASSLAFPGTAGAIATDPDSPGNRLDGVIETDYAVDEALTPWSAVTGYNNFYEFGTGKEDPARNAKDFKPRPWFVKVLGECDKPGEYDLDDFLGPNRLEERIYRFRCVEAWSMVVPWVGIPLASLLRRFAPNSNARYVAFRTLYAPQRMPGQKAPVLDWPYVEGLRIDEAMHPLSFMVVGVYGEVLPNQNGAPMRLMVPWKYGFKSIKSIVSINFTKEQPATSWNKANPYEYGFYSNVNPEVDHPRWSQKRERRIGEFLKRDTPMFNGYADQVASLYKGMDLEKNR
jgi:sulfoxide reductase catalytic subunit YedY